MIGTIARKISIHRATTVGPKSPLCQVILKNTSVMRDAPPSSGPGSQINRSQSLLTTNTRIPVLAPSRGERARLEALLSDVWTRDILPFPGITARSRSEHLVRASASSVMRKLSVVSITSSFTKRSASLASLQQKAVAEDEALQASGRTKGAVMPVVTVTAEKTEDTARSLLSVILDESERCSPLLHTIDVVLESAATKTTTSLLDREVVMAKNGEAFRSATPTLRQSSLNSSRPSSQPNSSVSTRTAIGIEKENMYSPPPTSSRASSRTATSTS